MINPKAPQPGKVRSHVKAISLITSGLMLLLDLEKPAPIIAVVLAWVVETGKPKTVLKSKATAPDKSAEKP